MQAFKLLGLLAVFLLVQGAASSSAPTHAPILPTSLTQCLPNASAVVPWKSQVNLVYFNWLSSEMTNYVTYILLKEVMGYPVSIQPDVYYGFVGDTGTPAYDVIANGTVSASMEMWHSNAQTEYVQTLQKVNAYPLGVVGQEGWWYFVPDYMIRNNALLNRLEWQDFQEPKIAQIFQANQTVSNSSHGVLNQALPAWASYDLQLIPNLNLSLELHYWGGEAELFGNMSLLAQQNIPFLTFAYQPHSFFALGIALNRLYLPPYSDSCVEAASYGELTCDYETDILQKAIHPDLKNQAPGAFSMIQNFQLSNDDDELMLGRNALYNYSSWESACYWVLNNNATWYQWTKAGLALDVPPKKDNNNLSKGAESAVIVVAVVVAAAIVVAFFVVRKYTNQANATVKKMQDEQKASISISFSDLTFGRIIGRGNFGEVFVGQYRGTPVAIKKLMNQKMNKTAVAQFQTEVQTMVNLRHPNILLFMGACTEPPNMSIVTEFMKFGNLYDFLHNAPTKVGYKLAQNFAISIAKGMQYIHAAGLLHRDLKTPNVLLDKRMNVKISDFGLSCLAQDENALEHVSLLWTAPEILNGGKFMEKSDIYSFGIIMWELLAQGAPPYPGISINAVAKAVLGKKRPAIQPEWDKQFVKLMTDCWDHDVNKRPNFATIASILEDMNYEDLDDDSITFGSETNSSNNTNEKKTTNTVAFNSFQAPPSLSPSNTFVLTNVQNSAELWDWNPSIMAAALAVANSEMGLWCAKYRGYKVASNGDFNFLVFPTPINALSFCLGAQQALLNADWPNGLLDKLDAMEDLDETDTFSSTPRITSKLMFRGLRIGMGVHVGLASVNTADSEHTIFHGPVVNEDIEVGSIARGGQILSTQAVMEAMSQRVSTTNQISIVVDGGATPNLFSKLEPHLCETIGWKHPTLGTLYQLMPAELKGRAFNGPTHQELLQNFQRRPTPDGHTLVDLPPLLEKWVINPAALTGKSKLGIRPLGDLYAAQYKSAPVAVQNVISMKITDTTLLKMRAESSGLATLKCDQICTFYGICISPLGLVWEQCPNGNLMKFLKNAKHQISHHQRVQILKDIVQGILFLRKNSIAFELTPANLLVDEKWNVKVADYGFEYIKIANQTITQNQAVSWTAPEVFSGHPEDEKALVYSFGIIMWQILYRKHPWEGRHAMKIMSVVESGGRPQISASVDVEGMSASAFERYTNLLQATWDGKPEARPSFSQIATILEGL